MGVLGRRLTDTQSRRRFPHVPGRGLLKPAQQWSQFLEGRESSRGQDRMMRTLQEESSVQRPIKGLRTEGKDEGLHTQLIGGVLT